MMSKFLRIFLLVLAVAALQCCGDEAAARVKRRVKPRPKKPLTLEELRFEVKTGMVAHTNNNNSDSLNNYHALHVTPQC